MWKVATLGSTAMADIDLTEGRYSNFNTLLHVMLFKARSRVDQRELGCYKTPVQDYVSVY